MRRKRTLFIVALSLAVALAFPASAHEQFLSQNQADELMALVRAVVSGGEIPDTPALEISTQHPVIVGWQDERGNYGFAAATGDTLRDATIAAAGELSVPKSARLYASVIYKRSRMPNKKKGVFKRGLYGLARNDGSKTCFVPAELIFYRGMSLNGAKRTIRENPPCCINESYGPEGYFRFRATSVVERADGSAAILFRGAYPPKVGELIPEFLRKNIELGADFLVRMIRENGQYYYQYDPRRDKPDRIRYNLLRHAGTTYSLYQVCRHLNEPKYCEAAERAWKWLTGQMKTERKGDVTIAYPEFKGRVKLGGAGLSLICLAERAKATGKYDKQLAQRLVNFVEYMQKPNGDVYYYYDIRTHRGVDKRKAFYYPGEMTLGLIRLYQVDNDPRYLEIARRTAEFLIDMRWKILGIEVAVPPDAWLTMALVELYEIDPKPKYAKYALKMTNRMLSEQLGDVPYPDYVGGFVRTPPGVTPAGGRMEAITAAYYLMKKLGKDTSRIERAMKLATRFQINCLVREEDHFFYPNPTRALGIFRKKPTSHMARIDYNQHNLSSLLIMMKILAEMQKR